VSVSYGTAPLYSLFGNGRRALAHYFPSRPPPFNPSCVFGAIENSKGSECVASADRPLRAA